MGEVPLNTSSVGLADLGGVIALSGTDLQIQDPADLLRVQYVLHGNRNRTDQPPAVNTNSVVSPQDLSRIEPVQSDSRWRGYVSRRLAQLRRGSGDFTGLLQPSEEVVRRARDVSTGLFRANTPTPSVVPSEYGDVLFIWHKAGWELEIEVGPEEVSVWAHERNSGAVWSGSLAELWPKVSDLLAFLAKQ